MFASTSVLLKTLKTMKLCLVGGFLGSGKTTAITNGSKMLLKEKISVSVIMNDQGSQLVDTAFTESLRIPNNEVRNGCFCCNYQQFYDAIQDLNSTIHPEIIFAEAVGSCADLVATILKPLHRFDPAIEAVLSVFADGSVLLSSLEGRSSFISEDVQYIYKKQLEEAGILIINKSDTLTENEIKKIKSLLEPGYPGKELLFLDSRNENSIKKWLDIIKESGSPKTLVSLDIDYEKYAAGEAALTWLDASIVIHSKKNAIKKSYQFIDDMANEIFFSHLPVGHVKFFLQSGDLRQKISYTSGDLADKNDWNENTETDQANILVNARVETNPDRLKEIFFKAIRKLESENCYVEVVNIAAFQPGYPKPTYRLPGS
jgi:G3E family GTPase